MPVACKRIRKRVGHRDDAPPSALGDVHDPLPLALSTFFKPNARQKMEQTSVTAPPTSEQLHASEPPDCIAQLQLKEEHGVGVMQDQF
jgi:hypothetical protein